MIFFACDVVADIDLDRSWVVRSRRAPFGRGRVLVESEERRGEEGEGDTRSTYDEDAGEWLSIKRASEPITVSS